MKCHEVSVSPTVKPLKISLTKSVAVLLSNLVLEMVIVIALPMEEIAPPYKVGVPPRHIQHRAGSERVLSSHTCRVGKQGTNIHSRRCTLDCARMYCLG